MVFRLGSLGFLRPIFRGIAEMATNIGMGFNDECLGGIAKRNGPEGPFWLRCFEDGWLI